MPILSLLLVALCDLGLGLYQSMQVRAAAEAGASYAGRNAWDAASISAAVSGATGVGGISALPAPSQVCGCTDSGTLWQLSCSSTCPSGKSPGVYALVNAQMQYRPVLPYPGLPASLTLAGQAYRRLK
jgi:hypothetical protein